MKKKFLCGLLYPLVESRDHLLFLRDWQLCVFSVYKNDCIIKRLIPFINKHHSDGNYVFWPDLASSHYARSVTNYLDEKNIRYVTKFDNPACVPELRPIEDFWSILKG